MNNFKQHLDSALKSATPDVFENITSQINKEEFIMTTNITKPTPKTINFPFKGKYLVAAAACFAVIFAGFQGYSYNYFADTTIGIDVNPSIELEISKANKVVDVDALNDDAELILVGMELENLNVETAVNAIAGSMLKNGFLTNGEILVTVQNENQSRADDVKELIVSQVNTSLNGEDIKSNVKTQVLVDKNEEIQKFANENNISYGKASYIFEIVSLNPSINKTDLVNKSIDELDDMEDALDDLHDDNDDDLDDLDDDNDDDLDDLDDGNYDDLDDLDDDNDDNLDDLDDDNDDDLDDLDDDNDDDNDD